jgi:Fur family ferric uptake transcriptional regulator
MNKLTKHRQRIFEVVDCTSVPVDAREVYHKLGRKINLATVYRGLQYLETHNYIRGFTLNCEKYGTVRLYHRICEPHIHFLHCQNCHRFFSYTGCLIDELQEEIKKEYRFNISHHVLYFIGTCEPCEKVLKNEKNKRDTSDDLDE